MFRYNIYSRMENSTPDIYAWLKTFTDFQHWLENSVYEKWYILAFLTFRFSFSISPCNCDSHSYPLHITEHKVLWCVLKIMWPTLPSFHSLTTECIIALQYYLSSPSSSSSHLINLISLPVCRHFVNIEECMKWDQSSLFSRENHFHDLTVN